MKKDINKEEGGKEKHDEWDGEQVGICKKEVMACFR
jgi:hypothetical protein